MGVAVADYDNDGSDDLYVTGLGHNTLYHNNGDGTFTDVTTAGGSRRKRLVRRRSIRRLRSRRTAGPGRLALSRLGASQRISGAASTSPAIALIVLPITSSPSRTCCYHNDGHGKFHDVSREAGFASAPGKGLGIAINDFDGDGWPDIFIANDSVAEQLFRNKRNGTFEEVALTSGCRV